jgi:hypothetical protein
MTTPSSKVAMRGWNGIEVRRLLAAKGLRE